MSDTGNASPPPMPEPPAASPPPASRDGCLTAFMIIAGIILLLPGMCALFFGFATLSSSSSDPLVGGLVTLGLLIGAGGVALIWAAIRSLRR